MPPAYEVLLLNTAIPQIQAAQSGDTYVVPRDIAFSAALTLSAGTANGVPYLNGSKVLTTGSALTFDGTTLTAFTSPGVASPLLVLKNNSAPNNSNIVEQQFFASNNTSGNDVIAKFGAINPSATGNNYGNFYWSLANAGAPSEQMRLTSTGLGIGTNNPVYKLDVQAATAVAQVKSTTSTNAAYYVANNTGGDFYIGRDNSTGSTFGSNTAYTSVLWSAGAYPMAFFTNGTEKMRLDSSGNLGLGVTPSSWSAGKAFEMSAVGNGVWCSPDTYLIRNCYYNGGWKYASTAAAANYYIDSTGQHIWSRAASGTAGNAITFTQAMTLDASGNLKLGGTADRATTAGTNHLDIFNGTAPVGTLANGISIYSAAGEAYVMDAAGNATLFSPHDAKTNEWIFKSKHTPTGKVLKIDVERLLKFVNDHFGLDAVHEFVEE